MKEAEEERGEFAGRVKRVRSASPALSHRATTTSRTPAIPPGGGLSKRRWGSRRENGVCFPFRRVSTSESWLGSMSPFVYLPRACRAYTCGDLRGLCWPLRARR